MGRLALFLVATVGFSGLLALQQHLVQTERHGDGRRQSDRLAAMAREAALSGYHEARYAAAHADPTLTELPPIVTETPAGQSRAEVRMTPGVPYDVTIRSVGEAEVGGVRARHVVTARLRDADGRVAEPGSLAHVPPYMRHAVFSGGTVQVVALPRVSASLPGLNANVHANGDLNLQLSLSQLLGGSTVAGFGRYGGRLLTLPLVSGADRAFRPVSNPTSAPALASADPVEMPVLDIGALAEAQATRVTTGALRVLGRLVLGTREQPETVHVRGDLVLVDTRIEGYGTLLVDGDVIVEATATGLLGALAWQPESHLAVYAGGSVFFNGVGDVQGQFAANGAVVFSAAPTLYGSISARGAVRLLVAPTLRFVPPSPRLVTGLPGTPAEDGLETVDVRSWRETP